MENCILTEFELTFSDPCLVGKDQLAISWLMRSASSVPENFASVFSLQIKITVITYVVTPSPTET